MSTTVGTVLVLVTLAGFAIIGLRARSGQRDLEEYLVARNSQRGSALGLSFFASGLGAWVLFSAPEIGAFVGLDAVLGYGVAAAAPFAVLAVFGPRLRRAVPAGHALTEFVRVRFGRTFHAFVVGVFLLYMLVYVTAELTAVGAIGSITAGIDPWVGIALVAVTTLLYTAIGGLPASLRTDRWQAWIVGLLLVLGAGAIVATIAEPGQALRSSDLLTIGPGIESALTLVIAVTAANLFHQGYWQRVWSAEDDRALRRGASLGGALSIPVVVIAGLLGSLAIGVGADLGSPPAPFFALLSGVAAPVLAVVLVLGVALVASSVDTLENGLASLVVAGRPRTDLRGARIATAALLVPAVVVALQGHSVLRLFLIADLLAAAAVVPALLALWPRATTAAVTAGGAAGVVGAFAGGWWQAGRVAEGGLSVVGAAEVWGQTTFASGVPTLAPFVAAVLASSLVAVAGSMTNRDRADLREVGAQVPALTTR